MSAQILAFPDAPLRLSGEAKAALVRGRTILETLELLYAVERAFRAHVDAGRLTLALGAIGEIIGLLRLHFREPVLGRLIAESGVRAAAELRVALEQRSAAPTFDNPDDPA